MRVETHDFLLNFPNPLDRQLLELEINNDPIFEDELVELLQETNGIQKVIDSARKAFVNDVDPNQYPEMAGAWPMLRNITREIYDRVVQTTGYMVPRTYGNESLSGLGQDFSGIITAIAPLIGSLASAGASAYAVSQQTSAQKEIAAEQLQANEAEIRAQQAMAAAQTAIANNQTQQAVSSVLPPALATPVAGVINAMTTPVVPGSGIQIWELALLAFLFMKK